MDEPHLSYAELGEQISWEMVTCQSTAVIFSVLRNTSPGLERAQQL